MDIWKYQTAQGDCPFDDWLDGLRDLRAVVKILKRLDRLSLGNFGEWGSLGNGVYELKERTGPGYRIYFGKAGERLIVLLCGGDKSTQSKDIARARRYWSDHLSSRSE